MIKEILAVGVIIIIFVCCLILQHQVDSKDKGKYKTTKTFLGVILAILLGIESTLIYNFFDRDRNKGEDDNKGEIYPNIEATVEGEGNFLFELEQREEREIYGFEIHISFPYSNYSKVMIWEYKEAQWFSIPAGEYEIEIYNHQDYYEQYPIKIEEYGDTHIILPIYDYRG